MRPLTINTHPIIIRVVWGLRKMALLVATLAALFFCLIDLEWKAEHAELHDLQAFAHNDPRGGARSEVPPESAASSGNCGPYPEGDRDSSADDLADGASGGFMRRIRGFTYEI